MASAHIIDQIFQRFRSSSLQKITLSVHVRTAVPLFEYQLDTWSQCEFLWIGYRCSNKNYFTLSKSCYLCISYVSVFLFCSFVFQWRSFSVLSKSDSQSVCCFVFFSFLCWLGVQCSLNNLLHIDEKGNRIDFPNFCKCNIKMYFYDVFVCYHTTSIHLNRLHSVEIRSINTCFEKSCFLWWNQTSFAKEIYIRLGIF